MNITKIKKIIDQGEGISVEFKSSKVELPSNLFETVCAFLNRNGGTILLGVSDNKIIEGVNPTKAEIFCKNIVNLSNNSQKLFPTFLLYADIVMYEGKTLIHIFIPISSQVHKCNSKIYDRSADGDFELISGDQIKNLYLRKSSMYSENTIYPYLDTSDFEDGIVERVRKIIKIQRPDHPWNELNNDEFFRTAGLFRKDPALGLEGFTMSALLLFGKPEIIGSALPHYKIDALLRIHDTERYDDRVNIRCNLIEAYDILMQFIAKHLPDKFYLEGTQRISIREHIFREVIANLLIHREYTNAFPSSFIISKDTVEIKNANKPHFYGQLLPSEFEPFPKNPHLAHIFTQMGRSEELGTGIRKVYKYSKVYSGSDKIEFLEQDVFITRVPLGHIFYNENVSLNVPLNVPLNKKILELIKEKQGVQRKYLAVILGVSEKTVSRYVSELQSNGKIERRGSKKNGGYFAI